MSGLIFWSIMAAALYLYMLEGAPAIKDWWVTRTFRKSLDNRDDFPVGDNDGHV